ncbi:MAG TPA: ABC-2 transporter permease [Candidatus Limnocylindrales bacterium]|nr:ABC-2 transporter permease [Candidatus Limnocylindrales bacterium]
MTGLLNAIRLDHRIMRARYPMLLLLLAIGVAVGTLSASPLTTIVLVTLITAPIGGSYFAVVETSRLDHLYGTLPLKRATAEAGIYVHTALLVAANGLLAGLAAFGIDILQHLHVDGGSVAVTFALAYLGACVYLALLYPLYLAVPFSKVYILTNVPFYVVAVGLIYVAKRTDWLRGLAPIADFYQHHPGGACALTIAAGLALLAISWAGGHAAANAARRR